MCRWMGSHFHNWVDYNGVTFFYLNIFVKAFAQEQKCSAKELTLLQHIYLPKLYKCSASAVHGF